VPVIASKIAGIPEVVRHQKTGMLVRPKDVKAMTKYMLALTQDQELHRRLQDNAERQIHRRMDKQKQFRRFRQQFRKALGS